MKKVKRNSIKTVQRGRPKVNDPYLTECVSNLSIEIDILCNKIKMKEKDTTGKAKIQARIRGLAKTEVRISWTIPRNGFQSPLISVKR